MFGIAGEVVVEELTVGGEVAVVEDERDFVFAEGRSRRVFDFVAEEEHAEQAGVGVEAVEAHGVIVVPERGGVLLERVGAGAGFTGDEPVFGVAVVFGGDLGAVKMGDGADLGEVGPQPWREWSMGRKCFVGRLLTQVIWRGSPQRASMSGARGLGP